MTIMAKKRLLRWVAAVVASIVLLTGAALVAAPPSGAFYKQVVSVVDLWFRTTAGQTRVYMEAATGSILKIIGSGGSDDTNLYIDVDGTYPVCYSSTDTKIGFDDDLEFVGAQSIGTSAGNLTLAPAGDVVLTPTGGDVTITGAMSLTGAFSPNSVSVTGGVTCTALSVTGTSAMTGALNLDGDLTFTGAQQVTTSAGNLTVAAAGDVVITPVGGDITVTGAFALDGDLNFTGAQAITTTSGNLSLTPAGDLVINPTGSDVTITGAVGLDGDLNFAGAQQVTTTSGDLTLAPTGDVKLTPTGGDVDVTGEFSVSLGATVGHFTCNGDAVFSGHVLGRNLLIPIRKCLGTVPGTLIHADGGMTIPGATTAVLYCPVELDVGEEVTTYTLYGEIVDTGADTVNAVFNALDNSNGAADATGDASGVIVQVTGSTGDFAGAPAAMTDVTLATNKAYEVKVTVVAGAESAGVRLFSLNIAYNSKP